MPTPVKDFADHKRTNAIDELESAAEFALDAGMSEKEFVEEASRQYRRMARATIIEQQQM